MMKKIILNLPDGLRYLGDWQDLQSILPGYGSCVLNKYVTGCGATTMFLADPLPTILCSPRRALMYSKAASNQFKGKIYLFRNESDPDDANPIELENRMMEYIHNCNTPFEQRPPKILVSYDSFKYVARRLKADGTLGRYQIIVDECQCLFTDSSFKGQVDMEFLSNLQGLPNRIIYISATPYLENYLDQFPEFSNLPYVQLVWKPSSLAPTNIVLKDYYRGRLSATVAKIIQQYRSEGFFEEKVYKGQHVRAREALFFLNNVKAVAGIISANGLTPADTTVICAFTKKNRATLKRLGFEIGRPPQPGQPRTPFTFVTKCSFEGADFNSQAYTYIFSDVNISSMAIDIALDLKQIMGRQRDDSNPFRYDATLYFKTDAELARMTETEFFADISKKERVSTKWIETYENADPEVKENLAAGKREQQDRHNFSQDFVCMMDVDGQLCARFNSLAMYNRIRAWEIRKTTYFNECLVLRAVDEVAEPDLAYPLTSDFLSVFTGDFEKKMRLYVEFLDQHPEYLEKLESLPQIPMSMKEYYRVCGPKEIKAANYIESNIRQRIGMAARKEELDAAIKASFEPGRFYSKPEAKALLQGIYDYLGFPITAKASDMERQCAVPVIETSTTIEGKRVEGYRIGDNSYNN